MSNNLALSKSLLDFSNLNGKTLLKRTSDFFSWVEERKNLGVFAFGRVLISPALHETVIADSRGINEKQGVNFASQDYLGLVYHQEVRNAAHTIIDEYGVHSAGSPGFCGRTRYSLELESKLANITGYEDCTLFPTGWTAGFSVIAAQVRENDTLIMDSCCHNCLTEGARHVTKNIRRFAHNNVEQLAELLKMSRERDSDNGLFIVVESLYSVDSDSPDLNAIIELAKKYEAVVILDVAHDFGAMRKTGLGLFETLDGDFREYVIVIGSFSKTFAANGGFILGSKRVCEYLRCYSGAQTFSNAISPIQTAVVNKTFDIIFSDEGKFLREQLMNNVLLLREAMESKGLVVGGTPSPIVPVFLDKDVSSVEAFARLTWKHTFEDGLHANLAEFPIVPLGKARFRFQVMATHEEDEIQRAAEILANSQYLAKKELQYEKYN